MTKTLKAIKAKKTITIESSMLSGIKGGDDSASNADIVIEDTHGF